MKTVDNKIAAKRALVAIAFASGLVGLQSQTAVASDMTQAGKSASECLVTSRLLTPQYRAFFLLTFASCLLSGQSLNLAESKFKELADRQYSPDKHWADDNYLMPYVKALQNKPRATDSPHVMTAEEKLAACDAIHKALNQLPQVDDKAFKLVAVYTCYQMYQELNKNTDAQKCLNELEKTFKLCESSKHPDASAIRASYLILNSMAYQFVPVEIPDLQNKFAKNEDEAIPSFSKSEFEKSERLRLRGVAIADRLPSGEDVRRKAHRDMSLWYARLSKNDKAEEQKQMLFQLVGAADDSLLYPQRGMCGSLVWWQTRDVHSSSDCGRG